MPDLYNLKALIGLPAEFVCLPDAAWAAKLRVAGTVVADFSALAAQLAEAQFDNLSLATAAKWRDWYVSHFASVLKRAVDQASTGQAATSMVATASRPAAH